MSDFMEIAEKTYTLYAGVNGAGKTTLYRVCGYPASDKRINSDEILAAAGGDWRDNTQQFNAMREAVNRINRYITEGVSFHQETTLSGNFGFVKKAISQGYKIKLYYVGLESADLAIQRVQCRVKKGGHGVEEDVIRKRYQSSLSNLKKILPMCSFVKVLDNTKEYRTIARYNKGIWTIFENNCGWFNQAILDGTEGYADSLPPGTSLC